MLPPPKQKKQTKNYAILFLIDSQFNFTSNSNSFQIDLGKKQERMAFHRGGIPFIQKVFTFYKSLDFLQKVSTFDFLTKS